ncbi:MAG: serine/threonine protein kinase, partial [Chloroflexi bacterium]|nr:serine/threonine protein kinase [Chloroflexota bacterium]
AYLRERIIVAAGHNAGLLAALVPELASLLGIAPDAGDPMTAQARLAHVSLTVLRAVASAARPLVMFLDDLQWAGRGAVGFADAVLSEEPSPGLLLVAAYRDEVVGAPHPLAAVLSRWTEEPLVRHLRLENLAEDETVTMVAEMLRVEVSAAAGLAGAISARSHGNPYETVELLSALHRSGAVSVGAEGILFDNAALRQHLGESEVSELLAERVARLERGERGLVEVMAILGGRVELGVLQTALGQPLDTVEQLLAPILEAGVLVLEPGSTQALRFRHDRLREATLEGLTDDRRRRTQLEVARRLAQAPEYFTVAAEQFVPVIALVLDPDERERVAGLLCRSADQAKLIGDHGRVEALLAAALTLIDPARTKTLAEVHTDRHAALFSLGRLDEADEEYRTIEALPPDVFERAEAIALQVLSLLHRQRGTEALELGLGTLRLLGIEVPAADRLAGELDHQFEQLYRWLDHTDVDDDLDRPENTDPRLRGVMHLIDACATEAYFSGSQAMLEWLNLQALRVWLDQGPSRVLAPVVGTALAVLRRRDDYAAAYRICRRLLAFSEARGYEPDTSQVRLAVAFLSCWFEPIEEAIGASQEAREGSIAGGDIGNSAYSYNVTTTMLFDAAASLDRVAAEVKAALAFARRTGNEQVGQWLDAYRWLGARLRSESSAETVVPPTAVGSATTLLMHHVSYAYAAAMLNDWSDLARHTEAAFELLPAALGQYLTAIVRVLRGLALAEQARAGDEEAGLLSELDELISWLAARAADAPDNFLHLLRLLEAERAWTAGDFRASALAFDAARREVARRQRPWHRALIAEQAARFYLAHGMDQAGHELLSEARQHYLAWGATAKVDQLDWAYPSLRRQADATAADDSADAGDLFEHPSALTTGTVDLLGILSASQAVSSETSIDRLQARVTETLRALAGATDVHLLFWDEDRQQWVQPAPGDTATDT